MKITSIQIPQDGKDGLAAINMQRLQNVVLIAGKNGSGKTRILSKIFSKIKGKPGNDFFLDVDLKIQEIISNLDSHKEWQKRSLEKIKLAGSSALEFRKIQSELKRINGNIITNELNLQQLQAKLHWNFIETDQTANSYSAISFVPKILNLEDCNDFSKTQMLGNAKNVNKVGVDLLSRGALSKIQVVQDRYFNSSHQQFESDPIEKSNASDDYQKLKELIKIFLNTEISRNSDGEAMLFNFPLGKAALSDGQKILLQFCIAIFSQGKDLSELILVLDEPENHLHPSVIIEVITRIQSSVSGGQIWIATHSIPLLAHFDPSLIWYVENGLITHAGKIPEKVLESLLGDETSISRLKDFIGLPAQLASSNYAYECLLEPGVVITDHNDPQTIQIHSELLKLSTNGVLRVLDYGAGKGRLIANISEIDQHLGSNLINSIEYIAFDKYLSDKETCVASIETAYGKSDGKYFNKIDQLLQTYDKDSFDIVIMCNVLHEIDPKDWLSLFKKNGEISQLLKTDGILLLIEDNQIPVGEKAYQKGFLVLDTVQLKELFNIKESDNLQFDDARGDGRLKSHRITRRLLENITSETRIKALQSISTFSKTKILQIRNEQQSYKNGKLHGFYTQQFANAELALSELTK